MSKPKKKYFSIHNSPFGKSKSFEYCQQKQNCRHSRAEHCLWRELMMVWREHDLTFAKFMINLTQWGQYQHLEQTSYQVISSAIQTFHVFLSQTLLWLQISPVLSNHLNATLHNSDDKEDALGNHIDWVIEEITVTSTSDGNVTVGLVATFTEDSWSFASLSNKILLWLSTTWVDIIGRSSPAPSFLLR